jgi:hypothetical protein
MWRNVALRRACVGGEFSEALSAQVLVTVLPSLLVRLSLAANRLAPPTMDAGDDLNSLVGLRYKLMLRIPPWPSGARQAPGRIGKSSRRFHVTATAPASAPTRTRGAHVRAGKMMRLSLVN